MQWLIDLFTDTNSVAHAVLAIMLVSAVGLALGHLKVKGISLGIAWVLFVGLAASAYGLQVNHEVLHFLREFGLILFVFTIGMQVGPGFFSSLRQNGLPLNLAAATVVLGGVSMSVLVWWLLMGGGITSLAPVVGLLCGATTNTPSLAAGTAAFADIARNLPSPDPAVVGAGAVMAGAYAMAYPFGIFGVLITMLTVRTLFRIDIHEEHRKLAEGHAHPTLDVVNLEVVNPGLPGKTIGQIPTLSHSGVVITRLLRGNEVDVAGPDAVLQTGDVLTAVGPKAALASIEMIIGRRTQIDARSVHSDIDVQRVLVSNKNAVGKTIEDLAFREKYDVALTRILRSGFELPVTPNSTLQFGDRVTVVGEKTSLPAVVAELGDNRKALDKPMLVPILLGIALGVIVGSIPIAVPGMPAPLKLGLAGGPLIVAIVLSRLYRVGPLVWYMSNSANQTLRELGIVIFLACVGLLSGEKFGESFREHGLTWIAMGALITIVPIMVVGIVARAFFKLNYLTLVGLLAGSMTDPPALAFAQNITGSDAPTVSYATVYPLVMLLRVLSVQAMVLLLAT